MNEYNKEINSYANLRECLMKFATNLTVTTINSIKLQSSTLAELTQTTNQLTRTTLVRILIFIEKFNLFINRCLQQTDVID
jgi:hypothetical protein